MSHDEKEFVMAALVASAASAHHHDCDTFPTCSCHVGKAEFAISVLASNGYPTQAEFHAVIGGSHWVLARKSERILEQYGDDVICLSKGRYRDAQRKALLNRTTAMGVSL